jgi:hypothetical protein
MLLLEALFMQISGLSLILTWPCRVQATSFPLSKHTGEGDTAPAFSGLHVCLQFMWEVGLLPSPVEFSSHHGFYNFPTPDCWVVLLLLPANMFVTALFSSLVSLDSPASNGLHCMMK